MKALDTVLMVLGIILTAAQAWEAWQNAEHRRAEREKKQEPAPQQARAWFEV